MFSASLSCGSGLGPAVDRFLRREDPQFSRVDATAAAALRSFDVALAGLAASSGRSGREDDESSVGPSRPPPAPPAEHPGGRPPPPPPPPSGGGTEGLSPPDGLPENPLIIEDGDVFIHDGDEEETTQGGTYIPPQKSRDEWGTRPPAAATSSRQVVATYVSLSKESSDSASSAPSTVNANDNNTNDNYNDKSGGGSGCGQTSLRPDTAAAVPVVDLVVPGRFGRGFGRAPDATPTAGGLQHDCRTFGCFRQAGGPAAATAVGVLHCCLVCFETEGRRHSRECDGTNGPTGMQRPWAPAAPRDDAGRRTDVPLHMDESDDPSGMDEIDSLKQTKRQQQQQPKQQQQRAWAGGTDFRVGRRRFAGRRRQRRCVGI